MYRYRVDGTWKTIGRRWEYKQNIISTKRARRVLTKENRLAEGTAGP